MSLTRKTLGVLLFSPSVLMIGCSTTSKGDQIQRFAFNESPSQIAKYLQGQPLQKAGKCVDIMAQAKKQAVMNNSPLGTQRLLKTESKNHLANEVDRYTQYHAAWDAYFETNATQLDIKGSKSRKRKNGILTGARAMSEAISPTRYKGGRKADEQKSDPVAECAIPVVRAKKQLISNDPSYVPMSQEESISVSEGLLK